MRRGRDQRKKPYDWRAPQPTRLNNHDVELGAMGQTSGEAERAAERPMTRLQARVAKGIFSKI